MLKIPTHGEHFLSWLFAAVPKPILWERSYHCTGTESYNACAMFCKRVRNNFFTFFLQSKIRSSLLRLMDQALGLLNPIKRRLRILRIRAVITSRATDYPIASH
jgi:hypothetical protein